ncbi:MAG: SDR family NAD(P)-dependent oxidoreductase, partial [Verrucomicrobiota bacterium]
MMRLTGKSIIVTGSCTGIGKAIALRCVAEGANVVIHGLEEDWAADMVAQLGTDRAVSHVEDITQDGCPERLVALAKRHFGKLDAVVNNAAAVTASNLHSTDLALFRQVLEVNTLAPFALIKAALPELRATHGNVLNIGSVNAY